MVITFGSVIGNLVRVVCMFLGDSGRNDDVLYWYCRLQSDRKAA